MPSAQCHELDDAGVTLIEVVVAVSLLALALLLTVGPVVASFDILQRSNTIEQAESVAQAELENVRALPFEAVGIRGEDPAGALLASRTVSVDNRAYRVETEVDWVGSGSGDAVAALAPGDGVVDEVDLGRDYKWVTVSVSSDDETVRMQTAVSPPFVPAGDANAAVSVILEKFEPVGTPTSELDWPTPYLHTPAGGVVPGSVLPRPDHLFTGVIPASEPHRLRLGPAVEDVGDGSWRIRRSALASLTDRVLTDAGQLSEVALPIFKPAVLELSIEGEEQPPEGGRVELVADGDFEAATVGAGYTGTVPGTSFSVVSGNVDVVQGPASRYLDLAGTSPATVERPVTGLTPGTQYRVRLRYAYAGDQAGSARVQVAELDRTWTASNPVAGDWKELVAEFTALAETETLRLTMLASPVAADGVAIDEVSVVEIGPTVPVGLVSFVLEHDGQYEVFDTADQTGEGIWEIRNFQGAPLEPGIYSIEIDAPGYRPQVRESIEIPAGYPVDLRHEEAITLELAPDSSTEVEVGVTDETGNPIRGAVVQVDGADYELLSRVTDAEGVAVFNLPRGVGASVRVESPYGHGPQERTLALDQVREVLEVSLPTPEGTALVIFNGGGNGYFSHLPERGGASWTNSVLPNSAGNASAALSTGGAGSATFQVRKVCWATGEVATTGTITARVGVTTAWDGNAPC